MLILNTTRAKWLAGVVIFTMIAALFSVLTTGAAADQGMPLSNSADCDTVDSEDEGAEPGETILHFVTPQTSDETTPVVTVTYNGTMVTVDASRHTGGVWHIYVGIPFGVDWDAYVTNVTYVGPQRLFLLSHCDEGGQTTTTTTAPTTTTTNPPVTTTTQPPSTTSTTSTTTTSTTVPKTTTTTAPPSTTTTNPPVTTTTPNRYICDARDDGTTFIDEITKDDPRYGEAWPTEAEARQHADEVDVCQTSATTNPPQTTIPEITTETLPFTGENLPFETSTMLAIAGALMSAGALALIGSRQKIATVAPTATEPTWKGWHNHQ